MLKSSSFIAFMGLFSVCKISLFIFLVLESALDSIKVLESNADSTFLLDCVLWRGIVLESLCDSAFLRSCVESPCFLKSLFVARLLSLSLSRGECVCNVDSSF